MGKKAKANNTTPEAPLLYDDPKWKPLVEAIEHLIKLTRSTLAALRRIETANFPTVSEDVMTGERKYEQPDFWKTNYIFYRDKEPSYAAVVPGSRTELGWRIWVEDPRDKVGGRIYFLSRSHFERLWPSPQQHSAPLATRPAPRASQNTKPKSDREVARAQQVLSLLGVPDDAKYKEVLALVGPKYKENSWELPKRDTIARARGRRK